MAVLHTGGVERAAADRHPRRLVDAAGAVLDREGRLVGGRSAGPGGSEALDEDVLAADRGRARHRRSGVAGHIERAVGGEGEAGDVVVAPGRVALAPELLALRIEHADEAVGGLRVCAGVAVVEGPGDRARDRHPAPVGRNGQGVARGVVGSAEGSGIDQISGGIVLLERHVRRALDGLAGGGPVHIGQHVERTVWSDGAGANGLHLCAQRIGGDFSVGRRGGPSRGIGLVFHDLGRRARRLARRGPHGPADIDRRTGGGSRETERLRDHPVDLEREAVRGLAEGKGLAVDRGGAIAPRVAHHRDPGEQPGGLQLAVYVQDDVGHGSRRVAHLRQIEVDRDRTGGLVGGDREGDRPLKRVHRRRGIPGPDRASGVGVRLELDAHAGLQLGGGGRLGELEPVEAGLADVGAHLLQPRGEAGLDLRLGRGAGSLGGHLLSQAVQGVEALVEGEQPLVIGRRGRHVELGCALVDELGAPEHRFGQGAHLRGGGGRRPRRGRGLGPGPGGGARRGAARAAGGVRRGNARARLVVGGQDTGIDRDDHGAPGVLTFFGAPG